jgi:hypothetical protein
VDAWIDGKLVPDPFPGAMDMYETGGIPPDVDHFFYRYFTVDSYKDVAGNRDFVSKYASTTRGSRRTRNIATSSGSSTTTGPRPSGTRAVPTSARAAKSSSPHPRFRFLIDRFI